MKTTILTTEIKKVLQTIIDTGSKMKDGWKYNGNGDDVINTCKYLIREKNYSLNDYDVMHQLHDRWADRISMKYFNYNEQRNSKNSTKYDSIISDYCIELNSIVSDNKLI